MEKVSISLMAVGDIMLGRKVSHLLKGKKPGWIFSEVRNILEQADVVIGNLETPIIDTQEKPAHSARVPLKASEGVAKELKSASFGIMNVANNHILDYGEKGLINTLEVLKSHRIHYVGAGRNINEARCPLRIRVKGLIITFLSYCSSYNATSNKAGAAPLDIKKIREDIADTKKDSDIIIVSLHHGVEYADYPTPGFIRLARQVIDFGAQVVLGHHPHVLQGIEEYNRGIIAYSLGNFIFDMADEGVRKTAYKECLLTKKYRVRFETSDNRVSQSMILEIELNGAGFLNYKIHPVLIGEDFRPIPLEGKEREKLIKRVQELSKNIGNKTLGINRILGKLEADSLLSYLNERGIAYYIRNLGKLRPSHFVMMLDILRAKLQTIKPTWRKKG